MYYNKENGISKEWITYMKNSIISNGGKYSTSRMLVDYTKNLYMPLCDITNKYYNNLELVTEYNQIKSDMYKNWDDIQITQSNNLDNISTNAGGEIEVYCTVKLPNISEENIEAQTYYGKILDNGTIENINVKTMELVEKDDKNKLYKYKATIDFRTGGNYGYTFRVMPKSKMLLDSSNLNLVKWITK